MTELVWLTGGKRLYSKTSQSKKRKGAPKVKIDAARDLAAWQFFMAPNIHEVKDVDLWT